MDNIQHSIASPPTPDPIPGTFSSKLIQPIPAHPPQPPAFYNPYAVYNPFYPMPFAYPPTAPPQATPLNNLAIPPNPTYHHLLPYLDSLISQRRASNPHPHLPPTAAANLKGMPPSDNFVNAEGSYFCRTPSPSNRQRTAQACVKCRERKTKCTGTSPCARCTSRGLVCTYIAPKDKPSAAQRNRDHLRADAPPSPCTPFPARPQVHLHAPTPLMFNQHVFTGHLPVPGGVPMLRGWEESSESDASSCPSSATSSRFSISSAGSSDDSLPPTPADDAAPLPSPDATFLHLSPLPAAAKPLPAIQSAHPQHAAAPSPPVLVTPPALEDGTFSTNDEYYRFLVESVAPRIPGLDLAPVDAPELLSPSLECYPGRSSPGLIYPCTSEEGERDASMMSSADSVRSMGSLRSVDVEATPRAKSSLHLLLNPTSLSEMAGAMTPSTSALLAEYLTEDALQSSCSAGGMA